MIDLQTTTPATVQKIRQEYVVLSSLYLAFYQHGLVAVRVVNSIASGHACGGVDQSQVELCLLLDPLLRLLQESAPYLVFELPLCPGPSQSDASSKNCPPTPPRPTFMVPTTSYFTPFSPSTPNLLSLLSPSIVPNHEIRQSSSSHSKSCTKIKQSSY